MGTVDEKDTAGSLGLKYGKQFERTLLWLLFFDESVSSRLLGSLDNSIFHLDVHSTTIDVANSIYLTYNAAPISAVIAELRSRSTSAKGAGKEAALAAVRFCARLPEMEAPSESERAYVLDRLADFVTQRATANALVESANLLTQGKLDEIREQIISALETGSRQVEPQAGLEFTNLKERLTKYAAHRKLAATVRSPLDLPVLDELLRGGLEPGTLGFFISPTGRGKTMALVNAGVAAMMLGLNVVHCTLELGQEVMAHRYDARLTGIPINEIAARASKYLRNMIAAAKKVKGSRLIIRAWGSDEASVADIRTYLRVLESSKGIRPQVLLVDYADLLRAYRAAKDRRFELADTVRSLRQLAADYNCAVWTASQTNREGFHSKVLSMHEIAECIEKANIADVLIGLCASREEQRSGRMRLVLLKNRLGGGEGTIVTCRVDAATQLIQQAARQPQYYGE